MARSTANSRTCTKVFCFIIGILLIPLCYAATLSIADLLGSQQPDSLRRVPMAVWAAAGGFMAWLLTFLLLPRPIRSYVLAHELTHVLWGAMMGASVQAFNVGRDGGSVQLTRNNFWITLSPYFFPLYTVIVIAVFYLLSIFWDVQQYHLLWLALVGFTWSFHVTFTISALSQAQTDLRIYGRFFSYVLIYLMNLLGLCLWIVLVSPATLETLVTALCAHAGQTWSTVQQLAAEAPAALKAFPLK